MTKYTFISEDDQINFKITTEFEAVSLPDILENFYDFLRGCGFNPKAIVEAEDD